MRLIEFIEAHAETILVEWEAFARGVADAPALTADTLRDHGAEILAAIVRDMRTIQSDAERTAKSKGRGPSGAAGESLNDVSVAHSIARLGIGFNLLEVVSEYRALRASVLSLFRQSKPTLEAQDVEEVTRFNEAIDQLITRDVANYTRKVDQARDMFLAILSHDLRNPLAAIGMTADAFPRVVGNAAQAQRFAGRIIESVDVMTKMVSDLLDYTRTRLGTGMPVTFLPMDLSDVCRAIVDEFQSAHPGRALRMRIDAPCVGEWDRDRLRQAISNLVGNALQHGDDSHPVGLALVDDGGDVISLSVHNGGTPISPGDLPRIFDPLVRGADADGPKVNRPGSIGLGLYIAREVARSHGGRIDVTSTAADGTTFAIRLPRQPPTRVAEPVMDAEQIRDM